MGLEFLQTAFLAGLAAVAIPVVIHLMHRRKSRTIPFPAIRFLKEMDVRTARRSRIRERWILLLRMAALALLALALARPVLRESGALGRGRASWVLVIDNSMSMDARLEGASALERARLSGLEIIQKMKPADRGAILALHAPQETAPALTENRRDLEAQLQAVRPTYLSTPLAEAIKRAYGLFENDTNPVREILVFTDLQASAFPEGTTVPPPPGRTQVILLLPKRPPAPNLAVREVEVLSGSGRRIPLQVQIQNFGGTEANPSLTVLIDEKKVDERSLRIGPGAASTLLLGPFELAPGFHPGRVQLGEDPLLPDNSHVFSLEVPETLNVAIARDPGTYASHKDPVFYLAQALRPAVSQGAIQPKILTTESLGTENLSLFDVVLLAEPARIGTQVESALRNFLQKGGGLFLVTGPTQSPDEFRPLSRNDESMAEASPQGDEPILPAALEEIVSAGREPFQLKEWAVTHPLLEPLLSATPPLQLGVPRFLSYWKVIPAPGAEVIARFNTGDPALVERGVGRGRTLLFASTVRPLWNNLPLKFSFVPLVHSAVRYLAQVGQGSLRHPLGTPLVLRYPALAIPDEVILQPPEGDPLTRRPVPDAGGQAAIEFGVLETPGLYTVNENHGDRRERQAFSVNPDLVESILEPLSRAQVAEVLPGTRVMEFSTTSEAIRGVLQLSIGSELKNLLLFILLALLFLEPVLANAVAFRREREAGEKARDAAGGGVSR